MFDSIDPIIEAWAAKHGLQLHKLWKDEQVRSVEVRTYQIWVDPPDRQGLVKVVRWNRQPPGNRDEMICTVSELSDRLDQMYFKTASYLPR